MSKQYNDSLTPDQVDAITHAWLDCCAASNLPNDHNIDLDGLAGETVAPFCSVYNQAVRWNLGGYTTISISSAATDANGYGTFEYAPPSGYYSLCTQNLAQYG